jgi:glucose/arabinose dehydrogenase
MLRKAVACFCLLVAGNAAASGYRVETVAEGLDHPWSLAFLPGDRALVTERAGRLRLISAGALDPTPIEGVPAVFASGQAGLFEVLPGPDFAREAELFLSFAHGDADANRLRVARARLDGTRLTDVTTIFDAQPAKRGDAHYGARMALLPDATLVIGIGDGFILREEAQRLDNHFGKFVRIARDGSVPSDNPFVSREGAREEVWSYGHRNPQAVVHDAARGVLYAHEHGPRGGDELNVIVRGGNYGWPLATHGVDYTGARVSPWSEYPETVQPLLHWTPSIAPAGMALYRGAMFPAWQDSLFVAALAEKSVRRIPMVDGVPGTQEILFTELGERIRDVRVAPDGALWLLTDSAQGRVLRVTPAP